MATRLKAVETPEAPDTMRIWREVEKTDPRHTKRVNQRGGFTAISANYQIMRATEVFGPIGIGWGYVAGEPIFHDTLCFVPVTLWHGDRSNTFGPMLGCEEWKDSKGRVDSDVSKKATTDAITKLLSQLGFNADVFLGLYDDNKYVQRVAREFAQGDARETARDRAAREADANGGIHPNNMPDADADDFEPMATAQRIEGLLKTAGSQAEIGQIWNTDSRADRAKLKKADPRLYAALQKTLEHETQRVSPPKSPQADPVLDDDVPF